MKINFLKNKKEKKFKKINYDISVNFYWKIMLYICLVFILGIFVFGFFLFNNINNEFVIPDIKTNNQIEKVKQERIQNVLNYYQDKAKKTESILNSPSPIVDPSL